MKIQANRKDTIWSLFGIILSMGANLLILPFILRFLDDDTVGLYYIFINLYMITSLIDFGFAPNFARSFAYAWSGSKKLISYGVVSSVGNEPNWKLIKNIISCCKFIYLGISIFSLILCSSLGTVYICSISKSFNGISHFVSWGLFVGAIFYSLYYGYFGVLLRGVGAIKQVNRATVFSRLIQIVSCISLLFCGFGLIGVSIGYFIYGFVFRIIAKKEFFSYGGIKDHINSKIIKVDLKEIKETLMTIWPNTWREGLITLSNFLLNQASIFIASMSLTLYETGVYSLMVQLVSAVAAIAGVFYTSYQPTLQSSMANRDYNGQRRSVSIIVSSFIYLFILGTIALIIIILPIIKIIKPSYKIEIVCLLYVSLLYFITRIRDCFCSYFAATNRLVYTKMFVISSFVCIILALLFSFVFKWGIIGLVIAQIFSQAFYNIWYWPILANKELHLSLKDIMVFGPVALWHDIIKKIAYN